MKRILPVLISFVIAAAILLAPAAVFAQAAPAPTSAGQQAQTFTPTSAPPAAAVASPAAAVDVWVIDPEVTFIGKNAKRSGLLLDWTIKNYNWVCVTKINDRQCDDSNNPIAKYWSLIVFYIVVPMLFVVILATSIVIIITRGKSLTIMRFLPRFIAVVLLIVFSYSLVQFLYQFTDLIQGFFLRSDISKPCPPDCISQADLLYVGWEYQGFTGLRLLGPKNAESAFISLLLTKLTALTYFVMVLMLLIRKIILWLFIIVSPIFPILLLFYPVRNTGKIWMGEFFRWLLYAPLFAIFLNGLVYLWKNQIPLSFANPGINKDIIFPTAVNILLGGPRQFVTPTNSVNLTETFALYVVSLLMLWAVILVPWILLQIFLDYASNFAPGDTAVMKTLVNMATTRPSSGGGGGGGGGNNPPQPSEGAAISLPFTKKFSIPTSMQQPTGSAKEIATHPAFATTQAMNIADVKVPSMRDIAKYDAALSSRSQSNQQEVSKLSQALQRISNPVSASDATGRNQAQQTRNNILQQSKRGNLAATSILSAANASNRGLANVSNQKVKSMLQQMSNPATASSANREKMTKLNEMLVKESKNTANSTRSQLAQSILSVNEKTSDKEVEKIKDQLTQTSKTNMSSAVSTAITQGTKSATQIQDVIKQMANPDSVVKTTDKQKVVRVKEALAKASKEGNQLATSILAVNDKTSVTDIQSLQERIQEAQEKGEPIAAEVAALAQTTATETLPMVNRVQSVNKEDYQAVKDMWKQNYQNLEVPNGMEGSRSEWIKDDVANIDQTISLLSSTDQSKVQEGMDQVSSLLPFLLMGGFSQNEIIGYLRAKQDAAKDVSQILAKDEEEKVDANVGKKQEAAEGHLTATMDEEEKPSEAKPADAAPAAEPQDPMDKADALEVPKTKADEAK